MLKWLLNGFLSIMIFFGSSCNQQVMEAEKRTDSISKLASGACQHLSKNHQGVPVLSWVQGEHDSLNVLYYSIYNNGFTQHISLPFTKGLQAHQEGMAKIAFKEDGEMIVMYSVSRPTPDNAYSALIYYAQSFNNGISWTSPKLLVADSSGEASQRFFDMHVLPDGELGVIWLDSRNESGERGSSLYFASTSKKNGFVNEKVVGESTCECCRTCLYVDSGNNIHAVYRDIINDSIRDMVHLVSKDNGISFTVPKRISEDNWVVDGCPHTGPDMTYDGDKLNFVWFTASDNPGVYYCNSSGNGDTFSKREMISDKGRHPQIISYAKNKCALVYESIDIRNGKAFSKIVMMELENGLRKKIIPFTTDSVNAFYPVVLNYNENIIVSWNQLEGEKEYVYYKEIPVEEL